MNQYERNVFSMEDVKCLEGEGVTATSSPPCLNVPLRDERIETTFAHCNRVEEITMETPTQEMEEYDDF